MGTTASKSSQSALRSGKKQVNDADKSSVLSSLANINEDDSQMQKIKGEFVEYVKEILTKTTSQVGGATAGAGGAGKAKTQKLSQMNMIEEVTHFLKEGRDNRQKVINNISIPELLKQTSKKESSMM